MNFPSGQAVRVHFNGWTLDSETRELRRGGEAVHLSPKAFRLLEALIEQRPAAVSKKKLMDTIWPNTFVDESNLASLIKENRTALHDDAREPKIIRTIFGHGYAFATEATTEKPPKARLESIAVLPFANLSGAEWDYVSDGIAEALLNKLTDLRSIRVVPRSTSFRYRSPHPDIKSAAAEMQVEAMVTGRVSERDGALTIQVELVNTRTDSQLWGGRFHGPSSGLQDLQRQVESEIIVRVVEHAAESDRRSPTVRDGEAYNRYLRGRHQLNRRDAEGFRRAIEEFRGAIEVDGGFAQAHAALAETYAALGSRDISPPHEIFPLARRAAQQALDLDASLASAHSALAAVQELYEWNWNAAEESHRKAVKLDPSYANAAQWFGLHYARRGIHDEAKYWINEAMARDPSSPIINTNAAFISYLAGDYAAAVEQSDVALDLEPHYEAARTMSGVAYIQVNPQRAIIQLEEAARLSLRQPYVLSHLASAYAAAGRMDDARRIADEMTTLASRRYVSPVDRAVAVLACGARTLALENLEEGLEMRSAWLVYLPHEPRLNVLRDEARFKAVVAALGAQTWPRAETTPRNSA